METGLEITVHTEFTVQSKQDINNVILILILYSETRLSPSGECNAELIILVIYSSFAKTLH